ncbi:hypothetical protein FKR81_04445 [Lentzea tibetensis]|uniref:Uncharacterized protein n=1 Tax=Lentzea tibetensis TaxID=2591470 RepID=A0A563EZS8_9PSEU|nr:hypothetical protein [Lentzea tibetensis]TWP53226.1 hypothetical protein FKR81_04445 [Lentzea tibetensis]
MEHDAIQAEFSDDVQVEHKDEIKIELQGPHGEIDPRALAEAIVALDKIIRSLPQDEPVPASISSLSVGSAKVGIRTNERAAAVIRSGLRDLFHESAVPAGWSVETVAGLLELDQVRKRSGVEGIWLRISDALTPVDEQLALHARESIQPPPPSLGSVRGELYRYNGHQHTAALRDYRTGKIVTVTFPAKHAAMVRQALDQEVEVWGRVTRNIYDQVESIALEGLTALGAPESRVALDDVIGLFGPDWTEGMDSADWIRRQRG